MDYIKQLKGFRQKRIADPMQARQQSLYMAILMISNDLHWPEWVSISASQLIKEAGLGKNPKPFREARDELVKKGYLETMPCGDGKATLYKIVDLTSYINVPSTEMYLVQKCTSTQYKNVLAPSTEMYQDLVQKCTTSKNKTKTNISTAAAGAPTPGELNDAPAPTGGERNGAAEMVKVWEDSTGRPMTPMMLKRVEELVEGFGQVFVEKAIEEMATCGADSVRYLQAILERWQASGETEPWKEAYSRGRFKSPCAQGKGKRKKMPGGSDDESKWDGAVEYWNSLGGA